MAPQGAGDLLRTPLRTQQRPHHRQIRGGALAVASAPRPARPRVAVGQGRAVGAGARPIAPDLPANRAPMAPEHPGDRGRGQPSPPEQAPARFQVVILGRALVVSSGRSK